MIFGRNRVEEDLEKIRHANLPPEKFEAKSGEQLHLEKNDLLAMVLAVLSLIIPYILIFISIMGLIVFMIYKLFL